eukprot:CAMPEP_0119473774 /NCGR_PEP_ID=MMETSP1344-20130328/5296_1 /TAXON_ID=236787 /ORGANISM="Florenciella parvula, Strain CCMP2471" /LENGTH=518 /DNA_ID=CAMNT_0007506951 /DNA_START=51 /DNA_END=1603 /DNA_ORIENTATION=-
MAGNPNTAADGGGIDVDARGGDDGVGNGEQSGGAVSDGGGHAHEHAGGYMAVESRDGGDAHAQQVVTFGAMPDNTQAQAPHTPLGDGDPELGGLGEPGDDGLIFPGSELAGAERRGQEEPSKRWYALLYTTVPTHLLGLSFFILLLLKLDQRLELTSWAIILSPLWFSDLHLTRCRVLNLRIQWQKASARRGTDPPRNLNQYRWTRLFKARCIFCGLNILEVTPLLRSFAALVDTLGIALTRMLVAYKLSVGNDCASTWLAIFSPLWVSTFISSSVRAVEPTLQFIAAPEATDLTVERAVQFRTWFCLSLAGGMNIAARGVQPLLIVIKLDGGLEDVEWKMVLGPVWCLLTVFLAFCLVLGACAPVVCNIQPEPLRHATRRLMFLCAGQLAMLCVCTFVFLTLLVQRLDYDADWSITSILMPIIVMYPVLLVLHPLVVFELQRFQRLVTTYTTANSILGDQMGDPDASGARVDLIPMDLTVEFVRTGSMLYMKEAHNGSQTSNGNDTTDLEGGVGEGG